VFISLDDVEAIKGHNGVRGMSSNAGRIGSTHVHSHRLKGDGRRLELIAKALQVELLQELVHRQPVMGGDKF
jgi:hypothetical protein